MWPSRAHVLKALTDKAGLKKQEKLVWTDEMQIAFDKMKKLMAADAIIAYPWLHKRWVGAWTMGVVFGRNTRHPIYISIRRNRYFW